MASLPPIYSAPLTKERTCVSMREQRATRIIPPEISSSLFSVFYLLETAAYDLLCHKEPVRSRPSASFRLMYQVCLAPLLHHRAETKSQNEGRIRTASRQPKTQPLQELSFGVNVVFGSNSIVAKKSARKIKECSIYVVGMYVMLDILDWLDGGLQSVGS